MMNYDPPSKPQVRKNRAPQLHLLPDGYEPDDWTVICGRGKTAFNHYGNKRLRILCEMRQDEYEQVQTKTEKSLIVLSIMDTIRQGSSCGGFVKQDPYTCEWFEVSDEFAREKIGQQLRENLSRKKRPSIFRPRTMSADATTNSTCTASTITPPVFKSEEPHRPISFRNTPASVPQPNETNGKIPLPRDETPLGKDIHVPHRTTFRTVTYEDHETMLMPPPPPLSLPALLESDLELEAREWSSLLEEEGISPNDFFFLDDNAEHSSNNKASDLFDPTP